MGATIALRNVVGEAKHVLVVAVVPPEGDLNRNAILFTFDGDWLINQRLLGAVEITDEGFETPS